MKITELIARHIMEAHEGGNWTEVNIKDTLAAVNYKEATMVTIASANSIALLVHHLTFYNEIVKQRLSGINPPINASNGFDMPAILNEDAWIKLKDQNIQSARELVSAVGEFPEEKLYDLTVTGATTYYKMLHGVTEHTYYHLGQIVILKNINRNMGVNVGLKGTE